MARRRSPRGLLLDLDGTLIDAEPLNRQLYQNWCAARGWPVEERQYRLFTGRRAIDVIRDEPGPWTGEDPVRLVAEAVSHYPEDQLPEPVPGAVQLIRSAAEAGWALAVVTSAGAEWTRRAVRDVLGVADLIAVTVSGNEVPRGKPDPAGYQLAAERLGVPPNGCLAVEDTPYGVQAARAARVPFVIGVTTSFSARSLQLAGATTTVPDLSGLELPAVADT